jgi:hypothetical protein
VANDPNVSPVAIGKTPATGTLAAPVNANFTGPNSMGVLNDVPPLVASGLNAAPLVAINGTNQNKLGVQGGESPKTHG